MERDAGDRAAPDVLAQPSVHRHRPFFCQVEAVETAIWLTEVAPTLGKEGPPVSRSDRRRQ